MSYRSLSTEAKGSDTVINTTVLNPTPHTLSVSNRQGSPNTPPLIQPKLKIGAPNDKYEQEADRVANQVMRMPEPGFASAGPAPPSDSNGNPGRELIQRQETEDEEEEETPVRAKRAGQLPAVTPDLANGIQALRGSGSPLSGTNRNYFEPRFGHDFSQIRIYTGHHAAGLARGINARAFTSGQDVVFGAGQYQPHSTEGRRLLAHELTHTVQQSATPSTVRRRIMKDSNHVIRRKTAKLQKVGPKHKQKVELPIQQRGKDQVRVNVERTLEACPCRRVDFKKEGIFYNDDLKNLAIAYRYCRGGTTVDVYGALQSNADAFLKGKAPPLGTARIGIDINIWAKTQGGRIVVEAIGTNEGGGKGVGGRAQLIYQGKGWRVVLEPQFLHRLKQLPGASTKNELQLKLGGKIGNVTIQLSGKNLLDPNKIGGTGDVCYKLAGNLNFCVGLMITKVPGRSKPAYTPNVGIKVPLPFPKVQKPECRSCFCPGPVPVYKCYETLIPPKPDKPKKPKDKDFRYYFKYDSIDNSEENYLQGQSIRNLSSIVQEVRKGGTVQDIIGYASPEATEKYNKKLSEKRAKKMHSILLAQLGAGVVLPNPIARGELLGRALIKSPSSRLVDVIKQSGFQSAEALTKQLAGKAIPNSKLAKQFIVLFESIEKPADQLALFGLSTDAKIAPDVLAAIKTYVDGKGKGRRPWEKVFRLLRLALTRVSPATPKPPEAPGPSKPKDVDKAKCDIYAKAAEKLKKFGEIDPSAKKNTTKKDDNDIDCLSKPKPEDLKRGCKYSKPKKPPKSSKPSAGRLKRSPELEEELRKRKEEEAKKQKEEELKGPKIAPHPLFRMR